MEVFSDRLRWLREQKGYSQQYMADKLGISQSYYGRIERNKGEPNLENLSQLPDILEESTDFMLGVTDYTRNAKHMFHKFEEASMILSTLTNDLRYIEIDPNHPDILSKDYDPNNPESVKAKIHSIKKNIPLWEGQFNTAQEKLLKMMQDIPHVKDETIQKIKEGLWKSFDL